MLRYDVQKNSDIEWIGHIPQHWTITKIKNQCQIIPSNVDKKSHDDEITVKLCNYVDVYHNDFLDDSIEYMVATVNEHELKKFQLIKKDVLITKDSEDPFDIAVPALVIKTQEKLVCAYHLSILRTTHKHSFSGSYLFWVLKDVSIASQLHREATGITRWAIAIRHVKNTIIPYPPFLEQESIATYLNTICTSINTAIKIKRKQLKVLDELRKSIIHKAVTRGLDDSVELKDSGVDWFKRIPKTWSIARLKNLSTKIGSGITPKGGASVYVEQGIPLFRSQNIHFEGLMLDDVAYISEDVHLSMANSQVAEGDVLLNITGASIGRCYFIAKDFGEANVNQHVCIIRPITKKLNYKYLYYLLSSDVGQKQIFSSFKGASREGLNFREIKYFLLPLPEINKQKSIVHFLDNKIYEIGKLKENFYNQIDMLEQYRKSLIHECVTGKCRITEDDLKET